MDVAVIWPKVYVQFHICYKPTNRLAHFASLGIPTVVYPFASYIDILVEFGYPLVAENLDDVSLCSQNLRLAGRMSTWYLGRVLQCLHEAIGRSRAQMLQRSHTNLLLLSEMAHALQCTVM